MFDSRFTQLGDEIYVYKNFVSEEELKNINEFLLSLHDRDWLETNKDIKWMLRAEGQKLLTPIRERIVGLSDSDMTVGPNTVFVKMKKGYSWGIHSDDYEFTEIIEKAKSYQEGDEFDLVDLSVYGIVVYFNSFEGGEIFYPEQNIEYHPMPGDMVIHGSGFKCRHGVKEILSDVRYSYSNHISKKIKSKKE
jgi:hypothetical protein